MTKDEATARSAMKLALEALDHNSLFTSLMPGYDGSVIEKAYKAINKALAEQQTDWEAVAADQAMSIALLKVQLDGLPGKEQLPWNKRPWQQIECPVCGELAKAEPPRRPWAELNYEDIHALMNEFFYSGMQPSAAHFANFARAIEAKLREKNT